MTGPRSNSLPALASHTRAHISTTHAPPAPGRAAASPPLALAPFPLTCGDSSCTRVLLASTAPPYLPRGVSSTLSYLASSTNHV